MAVGLSERADFVPDEDARRRRSGPRDRFRTTSELADRRKAWVGRRMIVCCDSY